MNKIIILLSFFFIITSGCDEATTNNNDASDEDKVMKTITNLPEYHDASIHVKAKTNGKHSLSSIIEAPNDEHSDYYIQVGYNEEAWFEPLYHFYINPKSLDVFIEDTKTGEKVPLETWRKREESSY